MCLCDSGERSNVGFKNRRVLLQCGGSAFKCALQTIDLSSEVLILFIYKCNLYVLKLKVLLTPELENLEFTSESESSESHQSPL